MQHEILSLKRLKHTSNILFKFLSPDSKLKSYSKNKPFFEDYSYSIQISMHTWHRKKDVLKPSNGPRGPFLTYLQLLLF